MGGSRAPQDTPSYALSHPRGEGGWLSHKCLYVTCDTCFHTPHSFLLLNLLHTVPEKVESLLHLSDVIVSSINF